MQISVMFFYFRITDMNAVNTALFILVWTFTAVCRADKGERINFTYTVKKTKKVKPT